MESSCEEAFLTLFLHLIAFLFVIQVQIYYYETSHITGLKPQSDQKTFSRTSVNVHKIERFEVMLVNF